MLRSGLLTPGLSLELTVLIGYLSSPLRKARLVFLLSVLTVAASLMPQMASAEGKYAAFVYDANKGDVLFERNADSLRYPASLTKMMTLYLLFDALDAGKVDLSTPLRVSSRAAAMPPSKLYLKAGSTIRVKDAILALITKSANDVAVTVAENLAGSESAFAKQMTSKARSIGMTRTTFANASGLPNPRQRTTARDMARLGLSLRTEHPRDFNYFSTRSFSYKGVSYGNHNRLLGRVGGVNGIKTGYIRASGFNLVTNVEKDNRHLVAVVLGGKSGRSRDQHMASLINRYIKKASPKDRRNKVEPLLVASTGQPVSNPTEHPLPLAVPPSIEKAQAEVLAAFAPIPPIRPEAERALVAALPTLDKTHAVKAASQSGPVVVIASLAGNPLVEEGSNAPVEIDHSRTTKSIAPAAVEQPAEIAETAPEDSNWKIQISATDDLSAAKEMLVEASQEGKAVLASKTPYTEPVQKGSSTLYRVRFAGFEDQDTARQACDFLKRKKYKCIYLN